MFHSVFLLQQSPGLGFWQTLEKDSKTLQVEFSGRRQHITPSFIPATSGRD